MMLRLSILRDSGLLKLCWTILYHSWSMKRVQKRELLLVLDERFAIGLLLGFINVGSRVLLHSKRQVFCIFHFNWNIFTASFQISKLPKFFIAFLRFPFQFLFWIWTYKNDFLGHKIWLNAWLSMMRSSVIVSSESCNTTVSSESFSTTALKNNFCLFKFFFFLISCNYIKNAILFFTTGNPSLKEQDL